VEAAQSRHALGRLTHGPPLRRRTPRNRRSHHRRPRHLSQPQHVAQAGRAALAPLPGFRTGDALASAVLTAAAPDRMAVYDWRAHTALHTLGVSPTHPAAAAATSKRSTSSWPRPRPHPQLDPTRHGTALYWLNTTA
jgi:hypothetical protein